MTRGTLLLFVVAACGGSKPASTPGNQTSPIGPRAPVGAITPTTLLGPDELRARGATVTKISDTESLVCGSDCVCLEQLECEGGTCISLDENLKIFKQALARDTHRVYCELADTGRLCDLSYFRFEGDIHRLETRYFDASGHLVGMTNATDYPEYCGGKAMRKFTGRIPDCGMTPWAVELICATDEFRGQAGQLPSPLRFVFE